MSTALQQLTWKSRSTTGRSASAVTASSCAPLALKASRTGPWHASWISIFMSELQGGVIRVGGGIQVKVWTGSGRLTVEQAGRQASLPCVGVDGHPSPALRSAQRLPAPSSRRALTPSSPACGPPPCAGPPRPAARGWGRPGPAGAGSGPGARLLGRQGGGWRRAGRASQGGEPLVRLLLPPSIAARLAAHPQQQAGRPAACTPTKGPARGAPPSGSGM